MSKEEKIVGQCKSSVSKELEALEARFKRIKNLQVCVDYEKDIVKSVGEMLPNSCNKVEQALNELQAIKNSNPSEAMEELKQDIKGRVIFAEDRQLKLCEVIEQALLKAQEDEKLKVDICEMFGLDNLFPYNDTKAILKELEEYMNRKNQLWVDFMKISKQFRKQEKVLDIIKEKQVDILYLKYACHFERVLYNKLMIDDKQLTQEEFNLLKEVLG